jgi:FtsH-binding integral membrane protein
MKCLISFKESSFRKKMKLTELTSGFLQNMYALLIMGLLVAISLAMNTIFNDLKQEFLSNHFTSQVVADLIYFTILVFFFIIFVYLYRGSLKIDDVVLSYAKSKTKFSGDFII